MEESDVIKDFRSGKMDPASEISKIKRKGLKGKLKNKISDDIITKLY